MRKNSKRKGILSEEFHVDCVAMIMPFVPGTYVVKGAKLAAKADIADDLWKQGIRITSKGAETVRTAKVGKKVVKSVSLKKSVRGYKKATQSVVNWTNHGYKHFPSKNLSWKTIVKNTKSGPAKYSFDIKNIEAFEREAWRTGKKMVKIGKLKRFLQ